jgi:hypothetical protein
MANSLFSPESKSPEPSRAAMVAKRVKNSARNQFNQLKISWEQSMREVWGRKEDTAAILTELGTDAGELFAASAATVQFLESQLPGSSTDGLKLIHSEFIVNEDGTVSLV